MSDEKKTVDLPILHGTMGPDALDVRALYKNSGVFTYDSGFANTAACKSAVTFIDGEKGILLYRGYPIEQLAEKSDFLEVAHLLMNGHLPNAQEAEDFSHGVLDHTLLHEQVRTFWSGFRRDAHPMAVLISVVGALSAFYNDNLMVNDPHGRKIAAFRLIAKIPTIAAWAYKYSVGQPFVYPNNKYDYTTNFMHMMFSVPTGDYTPDPVLAKALDKIFILHADHEQNASTSTVRLVGSTGANAFAAASAGIASLWGPAHGGANEAVLKMLAEIGSKENIPAYLAKVKDKTSGVRLMGFGHRVYKNYDPRAKVMQKTCYEVLNRVPNPKNAPLLELAMELERIALSDDYFVSHKLYPNVDFYSGIVLSALGIPVNMFTAIFAVARMSGWMSHWLEAHEDPENRIGRPRQIYTGAPTRDFVPMNQR